MTIKACVPIALQVVIDDVGWWCGANDSERGGPYRTGIDRDHVPADYAAIVELGKRLGIRPQAALILCEWDRTNVLRTLPTTTWMGAAWDNRRWVGPWLEDAARIMRENPEHVELTVHGIGHEYWEHGSFTRAEWFDSEYHMRPESDVRARLELYVEIMRQNELGPLPSSIVPPAYKYRFRDPNGFASILSEHGIRYVTTVTPQMLARTNQTMESEWFGIDDDLLVVEWGASVAGRGAVLPWYVIGPELSEARDVEGPVLGLHWPNLLHEDPAQNSEVIDRWVDYLIRYKGRFDRMLAKNSTECATQLLYNWGTELVVDDRTVRCDFTRLDSLGYEGLDDEFVVRIDGTPRGSYASLRFAPDVSVTPIPDDPSGFSTFRVRREK